MFVATPSFVYFQFSTIYFWKRSDVLQLHQMFTNFPMLYCNPTLPCCNPMHTVCNSTHPFCNPFPITLCDYQCIIFQRVARVRGAKGAKCALLRQPLACSWRSLSKCNTTTVVAFSLHRRARRTSSSFRLSFLVFSLSLCISVWRRFSSLLALCSLCSRLCSRL